MVPNKLSAQVFYDLPPVLGHYIEQERNPWLDGTPKAGRILLREQLGFFQNMEYCAIERRLLMQYIGWQRAAMLLYRMGFDCGRIDAQRHMEEYNQNARLALQAAAVFGQLQGRFIAETVLFEYDIEARRLYREMLLKDSLEAQAHKSLELRDGHCACWTTAGYFAGHVSEILGRRVLAVETTCIARDDKECRIIAKFDAEWGEEADLARQALSMESIEKELTQRDEAVEAARKAEHRARASLNDIQRRLRSDLMLNSLIAESSAMETVLKRANQVTPSDVPVLIAGEPGSGRETLARAIHFGGARRTKPFITVDCIGLSDNLLTQELFGYVRDGIPGATRPYVGAYQRAHGGTLYLSEIANLTLEAQVWLFRAMREGMTYPIGGEAPVKTDVRIIAATQENLQERVRTGQFLEHLYYAFSVNIELPPLREREIDILCMADSFLQEFTERYNRPNLTMGKDVQQVLKDCAWPGNIRQLRTVIEHAVITSEGPILELGDLPDDIVTERCRRPEQELSPEVVRAALRRVRGNKTRAAELLGIGRTSLWRIMKRLGIDE